MIRFVLPLPPSVNQLYPTRANGGRMKSKQYKQWILDAGSVLNQLNLDKINGEISVMYEMFFPDKRRRDCANYEKALSDLLVSHNIIEDDSFIVSNTQKKAKEQGRHVIVTLWQWEGEDIL